MSKEKDKKKVFVVNGIGHCGTTMVYLFLKNYHESCQRELITTMDELNNIEIDRKCVFKTHTRFPAEEPTPDLEVRTLYMFGDLFNIVPSYARRHTLNGNPICKELIPDAQRNLNIDDQTDRNFFDYDVFKSREHFDNWNKPSKNKVMIARYETLHDNLIKVLDFMGVPSGNWSKFPKFKKRKTNWKELPLSDQRRLQKTYGETRAYLNSMPNIIRPKVIKE